MGATHRASGAARSNGGLHPPYDCAQGRNREIARARLAALVRAATVVPKRRVKTKVSQNQKRKRVEAKKKRGEVKALRGGVDDVS